MLKLNKVGEALSQFTKQYKKIRGKKADGTLYQDAHLIKYKIVGNYDEYMKTGKLLIQSRRGSAYVYYTPNEILADEKILGHLHPLDAIIVSKLFNEKQSQDNKINPAASITKQYFSEDKQTYIYEIQKSNCEDIIKVSQFDILDNPHLVEQLSSRDAMSIGCQMGMDNARKIK